MQINNYAQHGEDDWLAKTIFSDKNDGYFVEVGAFDGVKNSNTLAFEQIGWHGICIEPVPDAFAKCAQNRKCICLNCAVGRLPYGGHEPWDGRGTSSEPVIDGTSVIFNVSKKDGATDLSGFVRSDNLDYYPIVTTHRTLTSIFEEYNVNQVDLLSVDTEGTEVDVLQSLDYNRWKPRIIIAEFSTVHYGDTYQKLITFLTTIGYMEIKLMGGNIIAEVCS